MTQFITDNFFEYFACFEINQNEKKRVYCKGGFTSKKMIYDYMQINYFQTIDFEIIPIFKYTPNFIKAIEILRVYNKIFTKVIKKNH